MNRCLGSLKIQLPGLRPSLIMHVVRIGFDNHVKEIGLLLPLAGIPGVARVNKKIMIHFVYPFSSMHL